MSTAEDRIRSLDPSPSAPYRHPDQEGMVSRILERTGPRPRRRALVLGPVLTAIAGGASALGLVLSAAGPASPLPALVLAASPAHGAVAFVASAAKATTTNASPVAYSSLDFTSFNGPAAAPVDLVLGAHLRGVAVHEAKVFLLVAPTTVAGAARQLAAELGMERIALRTLPKGVVRATARLASLAAMPPRSPASPSTWSFSAGTCTLSACHPVTVTRPVRDLELAPLFALSELQSRVVAVPFAIGHRFGPGEHVEFSGGALLRASGYVGRVKVEGLYPLVGVRRGGAILHDAFAPTDGAAAPRVVLRSVSLGYAAVELHGGGVALVPAYCFSGSDGLRYVVVAIPAKDLRSP